MQKQREKPFEPYPHGASGRINKNGVGAAVGKNKNRRKRTAVSSGFYYVAHLTAAADTAIKENPIDKNLPGKTEKFLQY